MERPAKKPRTVADGQYDLEDLQEAHCEEEVEVCTDTTGLKAGGRDLSEGLTEVPKLGDQLPKNENPPLKRLSLSLKKVRPKLSAATVTRRDRHCKDDKVHVMVEDEVGKNVRPNVSSNYKAGGSNCEPANEKEEASILDACTSTGELSGNGQEQEEATVPSPGPLGKIRSEEEINANSSFADISEEIKASAPGSEPLGEMSEKLRDQTNALSLPLEVGPTIGGAGSSEAYYSANFKSAINSVLTSSPERHVISGEAVETVDRFMALPEPQQQLYVRLFLRKHHWIRASKLSYKDIADNLQPVTDGLVATQLLVNEEQLTDPAEVLNLLQLHELRTLCKSLNLPPSVVGNQKAKIVESLFKHSRQHRPLFGGKPNFLETVVKKAKSVLGGCVMVSEGPVEVFSRVMLLFSLTNSWMQRSEDDNEFGFSHIIYRMLQVNIGRLVYPDYEISVTQPIFSSGEEFERFYSAVREEQQLLSLMDEGDTAAVDLLLATTRSKFEAECQTGEWSITKSVGAQSAQITDNPDYGVKQDSEDSGDHLVATMTTKHSLPFLCHYSAGWVHARALSTAVEYLEKQGRYEGANDLLLCLLSQNVYCRSSRGRWWERLALNLDHHLRLKEESLEIVKSALEDPHLRPARRLPLLQRAHKLCQSSDGRATSREKKGVANRKKNAGKIPPSKRRRSSAFTLNDFPMIDLITAPEVYISGKQYHSDLRSVFAASTGDSPDSCALVRVEGFAMYHYSSVEGWPCALHAEASSFTAMFILLMWDVIFTSGIPDVFRTPYQAGPLDFYSSCFYNSRREMIEVKLHWLREACSKDISSAIENTWTSNYGKVCAGMIWELFPTVDDAKNLAVCMGGNLLSLICKEFSNDYGHCTGGLPDLTLWNPSNTTCKFVEVKGPGDRLSHKQMVWLSRLAKWGCSVEVCRVRANSY